MSDTISEDLKQVAPELTEEQKQEVWERAGDALKQLGIEEKPVEKCYVCGYEVIYKYDGTGPICETCCRVSDLPSVAFTTDEKGRRIFDISNVRGTLRRSRDARPGDLVKENKKLYEFQKDFSLKRIDKIKKI